MKGFNLGFILSNIFDNKKREHGQAHIHVPYILGGSLVGIYNTVFILQESYTLITYKFQNITIPITF